MSVPAFGDPGLDALCQMLRGGIPEDIRVYDTDASHVAGVPTSYPYVVVSGGAPRREYEALGACSTGVNGLVRVTSVALSAGTARSLVRSTRRVLEEQVLPVPGGVELQLWDAQGVDVDRDVKVVVGTSSSFPFFGVDIYRLRSSI